MADKVFFDPINRLILVTLAPDASGNIDINFKEDIYSAGKIDWIVSGTLNKMKFPIRGVGGDDISATKKLGSTFFLQYGWRIIPYEGNQRLRIEGNIYTDPFGDSIVYPPSGSFSIIVENTVSNLTDSTLAQLPQIEYASFQNGVWVDVVNGGPGTDFPLGTPSNPSNNLTDAKSIATSRGFNRMYILEDLHMSESINFNEFYFEGESHVNTQITIEPTALVTSSVFSELEVSGTLDGGNELHNCVLHDISYFNGHIHNCGLKGTIYLNGGLDAVIVNCITVDPYDAPVIDMGGAGQNLAMPNYSGLVTITNVTGSNTFVGIGLTAGQVYLDIDNITSGTFQIVGIGNVTDMTGSFLSTGELPNGGYLINECMSKGTISDAVLNTSLVGYTDLNTVAHSLRTTNYHGIVSVLATSPYSGSNYPNGTTTHPVNNIVDAATIASATGIETIHISGDYTFTSSVYINQPLRVMGDGKQVSTFTFDAGAIVAGCKFFDAKLTGEVLGIIGFENCFVEDFSSPGLVPSSASVVIQDCLLKGTMSVPSNFTGEIIVLDSWMLPTNGIPPTFNMNGSESDLQVRNLSGFLYLESCSNANNDIRVFLSNGGVRLQPSVTAGNFTFTGTGNLINSASSWTTLDTSALIYDSTIATAVWDEPLVNHTIARSTGKVMALFNFSNEVRVNSATGQAGTDFPIGTLRFPSNNFADALLIASGNAITTLSIEDTEVSTQDFGEIKIVGALYWEDNTFDLGGYQYLSTNFDNIKLTGNMATGSDIFVTNGYIDGVQNMSGEVVNCRLANTITVASGAYFSGVELVLEGDETVIDLQNQVCTASFDFNSGYVLFINAVTGSLIEVNTKGGEVELDSSCVDADFYIEGVGRLYDNSTVKYKANNLISLDSIPYVVWDEQLSTYVTPGSAGYALSNVSAGASPALIAQAVWNDTASLYTDSSSFGYIVNQSDTNLQLILGLVQHNFRMTNQVYDANGNMTSAEVNIYPTSGDATSQTNSIKTYYITAVYDTNNRLIDYKMVE